jgi:alkylhydroperoxidase family enzyme
MARVPMVDAENEPEELKLVFDQLRRTRGRVPGMYRMLAQHSGVLAAHRGYFHAALDSGVLPRAFKERIVYKVVRLCGSEYSSGTHRGYALKHGVTAEELDAIDRSAYAGLEPRLAVALEFAEAMVKNRGRVSDDLVDQMKSHYSIKEFVELAAVIGLVDFACMLGAVFDLQPE